MSGLREYLVQKRTALQALQDRAASPDYVPVALSAHVRAEGRSGVRRIRVRDFQVITDSPPDFAGYDLGPSSPELVLGALGSCLTHTWLIQAAAHDIPIDSLLVDVTGTIDARAGKTGHEHVPVYPHNIAFTVHVASPVDRNRIDTLELAVDRACPILNLLRTPQVIRAETEHLETR
jgi:uncharacterized OsmC-like protein